jgi:hypothetical protein
MAKQDLENICVCHLQGSSVKMWSLSILIDSVTLFVLFIAADEVLDEVERLRSFVDHQTDGVSQVARVSLLVPRLVDDLVVSFDL